MYFEKETMSSGKKPTRKVVWMVLAGVAAVTVGLIASYSVSTPNPQALQAYSDMLLDHHEFVKGQKDTVDTLIKEGHQHRIQTMKAALNLVKKAAEVQGAVNGIQNGVKAQDANVKWGQRVATGTVDPKKLQQSFANSKTFAAEISKIFPKSYNKITALRQDLKVHNFDLANLIHDVSLLAETTKVNAKRTIRKLSLRGKMKAGSRLSPNKDAKIWKYAIKAQINDLANSLAKCDETLVKLDVLQKNCARTQDDLEKEVQYIKTSLEKSHKLKANKIKDLEARIKATGCVNNGTDLVKAIFSFGISCAFDSDLEAELKDVRYKLREEMAVTKSLLGRMNYFDGLVNAAKQLTAEATGLVETTKRFRQKIFDTKSELEQDFTDEDIEDNLGDEDFANEMADTLNASLVNLMNECEIVAKDTLDRKHRLDKVLIYG